MFQNNLKIAWRNLIKDPRFSLLNLIGLATGLACVLLIWIWVHDEMQVDKFNQNDDKLYQVLQTIPLGDGTPMTMEYTPDLLGAALQKEIPEIEEVVMLKSPDVDGNSSGGLITSGYKTIKARELCVQKNFFHVFSYDLIDGSKEDALSGKSNVLISDTLAEKLFHTTKDLIGKSISWDRGLDDQKMNGHYTISGIFKAPPANATKQFDILFNYAIYFDNIRHDMNWFNSTPETYVLLKKGTDINKLNKKMIGFIKSKLKAGNPDNKWAGTLFLQKYSDKYLYNLYENGTVAGGRIEYVRLFSFIAIFLLVIACVNFMNLSTAKASRRMKEVGIKKVVGASRSAIMLQYIGESMIMSFVSLILAMLLVVTLLPAFRDLSGKNLSLNFTGSFFLIILGVTAITGLISGSYPAFYLSGFRPASVLKGKLSASVAVSLIRKGLVVFQFTISIMLIISVLAVSKQITLIRTKNLGYNRENIVRFSNEGNLPKNLSAFLAGVKSIPGVSGVTDMEGNMVGNHSGGGGIDWPGQTESLEFSGLYADYDFMETMGLKIKEGRSFSDKFKSDSAAVIFSETAIADMKLKDPVGKTVKMWGVPCQIIGVVRDFHYESLYKKMGPFFLMLRKNNSNILVKIKSGVEKQTLAQLTNLYRSYNPGLPFEYKFLDEDYQALYASEERVGVLSKYFAGIAVLISCLGLFGLAAFTAEKRKKEIGIRKIIGASITELVMMLSSDFLKLVLIAQLIAMPLSWWLMNHWLNGFAYRVNLTADLFLITAVSIVLITLVIICFQTIKAALENPVKSLRTE